MRVLKTAKNPVHALELETRRQNYFKDALLKSGIGKEIEKTADWKKLMFALIEEEGKYTITSNGRVLKNETMNRIEGMVYDSDYEERILAAVWLGEMRVNFPEFCDRKGFPGLSGWMDEMLIVLGTDRNSEVRGYAIKALNKTVSIASIAIRQLEEMDKQEKKELERSKT